MGFLGGIRGPELILILVIVMIIFGVGRLPEVGGALGKAIKQFRSSANDKNEPEEGHPIGLSKTTTRRRKTRQTD